MEYEFLCKTFRYCIDEDCCSCPLYDFEIEHCEKQIKQQALAFINRQQAEIERLHEVINDFEEQSHKELMDYMQLSEKYENARAEAVRECIKKIKSQSGVTVAITNDQELYETKVYAIRATKLDEILKEMTEERK